MTFQPSESLLFIKKIGEIGDAEFSKLIDESVSDLKNYLDSKMTDIEMQSTIKMAKLVGKITTEDESEILIKSFQKRAKKLYKDKTCCIAGCENNTSLNSEGGLSFCKEHDKIRVFHAERHSSYGKRLPVLMLVWDDTPYRHANAGSAEITDAFRSLIEKDIDEFLDKKFNVIYNGNMSEETFDEEEEQEEWTEEEQEEWTEE